MLRFRLLVSAVPIILIGVFARDRLTADLRPCVALGESSIQMASTPWQTSLQVGFTDNPALATVRVQIVDRPEDADFAVADDGGTDDAGGCALTPSTRFVAIASRVSKSGPVIYLSPNPDADYRVYVNSRSFTAHEAAALIVGARGGHNRLAAAAL